MGVPGSAVHTPLGAGGLGVRALAPGSQNTEGPGRSCLTSEEPFQIFPYILTHWTKLNFAIFSASTSWANTASRERHLLPTCRFRPGAREPTVILREPTRGPGKRGHKQKQKGNKPQNSFYLNKRNNANWPDWSCGFVPVESKEDSPHACP